MSGIVYMPCMSQCDIAICSKEELPGGGGRKEEKEGEENVVSVPMHVCVPLCACSVELSLVAGVTFSVCL